MENYQILIVIVCCNGDRMKNNLGSFFLTEANLKEQVDKSLNLPPTYETLVSRAQLASVSSFIVM